jgi:type I restriction enzyme R subunit
MLNQNPEQLARDHIDKQLLACGWVIQDKKKVNLSAGIGVAVREYQTDAGPADYVLFVDKKPVGIIEAKREEEGVRLTAHEDQSLAYATAKLKYLDNDRFLLSMRVQAKLPASQITAIPNPDPEQYLPFTGRRHFKNGLKRQKH